MKLKLRCFLLGIIYFSFFHHLYSHEAKNKIIYDTLGGVTVTKENLLKIVKKPPIKIIKKVISWLKKYPGAYNILLKQGGYLTDVGYLLHLGRDFFKSHKELNNLSTANYVFYLPEEQFFIKISGPSNRFYNSLAENGLGLKNIYTVPVKRNGTFIQEFVDFEKEKNRIKKYFRLCCPKEFLYSKPTKSQLKKLAYMAAGAISHAFMRGISYASIRNNFLGQNEHFAPKTIGEAFSEFVEHSFGIIEENCYNKANFANKKFVDTYNIASRIFYRERFAEAIDNLNLDQLEKPPVSYIMNLEPSDWCSCEDKNTILIQCSLKNHKSMNYYVKHFPEMMDEIFTQEVINQLLQAMQYSGVWDINFENVYVNTKTKKITLIDFEYNRDIKHSQLFNKDEEKRKNAFFYLIGQCNWMFSKFPKQKEMVSIFVEKYYKKEYAEFLEVINKEKKKAVPWRSIKISSLGFLLRCEDARNKNFISLAKQVYNELYEV